MPEVSTMLTFHPITSIIIIITLALLPFLFLGVTSFVKISVVFNILRNGIGATQVPSGAITSLLSIVLTIHVMTPVFSEAYVITQRYLDDLKQNTLQKKGSQTLDYLGFGKDFLVAVSGPFMKFMKKHTDLRERVIFSNKLNYKDEVDLAMELDHTSDCAKNGGECAINNETFATLLPAFMLSELKAAFIIGFMILLPFLVIDLVVSNILIALGMTMIVPSTVAFPFKLLLFVASDAWLLLTRSLVLSYQG